MEFFPGNDLEFFKRKLISLLRIEKEKKNLFCIFEKEFTPLEVWLPILWSLWGWGRKWFLVSFAGGDSSTSFFKNNKRNQQAQAFWLFAHTINSGLLMWFEVVWVSSAALGAGAERGETLNWHIDHHGSLVFCRELIDGILSRQMGFWADKSRNYSQFLERQPLFSDFIRHHQFIFIWEELVLIMHAFYP